MNGRGVKIGNEYAAVFAKLYERTPKAVFAAVALSFADRLKDESIEGDSRVSVFLDEWRILNENGIVPQKPPKL